MNDVVVAIGTVWQTIGPYRSEEKGSLVNPSSSNKPYVYVCIYFKKTCIEF